MTDTVQTDEVAATPRPPIDPELVDRLMADAGEEAELLGPDGLLSGLTKAVMERALKAELTADLGYEAGDPAGHGSGNSRNGAYPKTVLTELGAVELAIPRDRNGSFEPKLVPKGTTRLAGFNERVISMYARGMTVRDIQAHLAEMYQVEISPDLISTITDAVLDELRGVADPAARRGVSGDLSRRHRVQGPRRRRRRATRPRTSPSASTSRAASTSWASGWQTAEGAKFWLRVLTELTQPRRRGRLHRRAATGSKAFPRRSRRCGRRPACRPASCT